METLATLHTVCIRYLFCYYSGTLPHDHLINMATSLLQPFFCASNHLKFQSLPKPATHLAILYADCGAFDHQFAAINEENRGNGHTWRMPANLIADI